MVAFATTALAAALLDQRLAAAIVMPLIMFTVVYGAARGPRYGSLAMVGLIGYLMGLVTRQPPDTLPIRLVVLILAAGDPALIRHVVLPERPQIELDRLRRAIHAGIVRVLGRIAAACHHGCMDGCITRRTAPRRLPAGRNGHAGAGPGRRPGRADPWPGKQLAASAGDRAWRRTGCTCRAARPGRAGDRSRLLASLDAMQAGMEPPPQQSSGPLGTTLALLGRLLREPPRATSAPAAAPPPANTGRGLRPALQTAIAAGLAIIGGDWVSPNRWYWAAFAAFVMFQGTRSLGESIAKGVQFMAGTLAGAVVGVVLATLLSGHQILTLTAIIVAVFLAFQANVAAYGAMIFWITIILGLLFGMLGYFPPELLLLRLQETAVGAACGAAVASLVLVRRGRAATQDATIAFLRALGPVVDRAAGVLLHGTPEPALGAGILAAEQRFRDLCAITHFEQSGLALPRGELLRRRMLLLEACEHWARELGEISLRSVVLDDPALARLARDTVARIDITLPSLIDRLANASSVPPPADEPLEDLGQTLRDDLSHRAVRLLLRIDGALVRMASR